MHIVESLESRIHLSRGAATGLDRVWPLLTSARSAAVDRPRGVGSSWVRSAATIAPATDLTGSYAGYASDGKLSIPYRLLIPQLADSAQKVPLILFLHGSGDAGTDNVIQTNDIGNLRANTAAGPYAAYILAPQNQVGVNWYVPTSQPTEIEKVVMSLIKALLPKQPNIDPTRIYITGASIGSAGAFDLMQRNPDFFAAGVPVSGAPNVKIAPRLKHSHIWAFHGSADGVVSPIFTRKLIAAIVKAGGSPWYTEIPGGGHNIVDPVYSMPELYEWMFSQHLTHPPK
jgi:predicted peptidase